MAKATDTRTVTIKRELVEEMRHYLLEDLYTQPKYSQYAHKLAKAIHRADVALGETGYTDFSRSRYPGPKAKAKKRKVA